MGVSGIRTSVKQTSFSGDPNKEKKTPGGEEPSLKSEISVGIMFPFNGVPFLKAFLTILNTEQNVRNSWNYFTGFCLFSVIGSGFFYLSVAEV